MAYIPDKLPDLGRLVVALFVSVATLLVEGKTWAATEVVDKGYQKEARPEGPTPIYFGYFLFTSVNFL